MTGRKSIGSLYTGNLELSSADSNMTEMLKMQKEEANNGFAKYIAKNYLDWVAPQDNKVSNSSLNWLDRRNSRRTTLIIVRC